MARTAALPFTLTRSDDVIGTGGITSTRETVHGLLLFNSGALVIQWRLARRVERVGEEIRSDSDLAPVNEVTIPLQQLATVSVRRPWWHLGLSLRIVLTAADLRAFENIVGRDGFKLAHPAELVLSIKANDWSTAREFASELEMALAEQMLRKAEEGHPRVKA